MTVAELVAKLQTMPQDMPVYINDSYYGPDKVTDVEQREIALSGTVVDPVTQMYRKIEVIAVVLAHY